MITKIKDARNKLLHDAQAILLASPDAEKRAQANAMLAEADILEADIASLERIAKTQSEERSRTTPPRGTPNGGLETTGTEAEQKSAEQRSAFERFLRYGVTSPSLASTEHRDMVTTGGSGQLIPQSFYPVLTETLKFYGNILNVVTQTETADGSPQKFAVLDDTANGLTVIGEDAAPAETDPTVTGSIISTDVMSTGTIKVSLAQLQDSNFNVETFLRDSIGKRYYRGLSKMVTLGNASNIPSIVTSVTQSVTSVAPTAIAWADVAAVFAALDPAYESNPNTCWSLNTTTRGALIATTDTLGRPLYIPAPSADAFDMILGKKVIVNPFMVSPTNATVPVLYGDHSQYVLRNVAPGLTVYRLNERFLDQGMIGFIAFARAGGGYLAGSVSPLVKLTMHA